MPSASSDSESQNSISEVEALEKLRAFGTSTINESQVAKEFGWTRSKLQRFRKRVGAHGLVNGQQAPKAHKPPAKKKLRPLSASSGRPSYLTPIEELRPLEAVVIEPDPPPLPAVEAPAAGIHSTLFQKLMSGSALTAAVGIAALGGVLNASFAASYGTTTFQRVLFAAAGVGLDIVSMLGLAWAAYAPGARAWAMRALWLGCLSYSLLAASGFAARGINDTTAARQNVVEERANLNDRLKTAKRDRSLILEAAPVEAIQAKIAGGETIPPRVWMRSDGCRNVTQPGTRHFCAQSELNTRLSEARRRDVLDKEIVEISDKLNAGPALAVADPGADAVAALLPVGLTAEHVNRVRGLLMMLLIACPSVLLRIARG